MAMKRPSVVVVDDDVRVHDRISNVLDSTYTVLTTADPRKAMTWLQNDTSVSAVLVSQELKAAKALTMLQAAQKVRPEARRILIANYSDLALFVEGLHSGAVQRTISRPIDAGELLSLVRIPLASANPNGVSNAAAV
jgi:DNA-binding NtrC family response regulator